ncbi:hypothetical protein AWB71_02769 [Caballeronia peredens]|nr:hypothetical protein AWB71_02769 [Caballeronia peredens]
MCRCFCAEAGRLSRWGHYRRDRAMAIARRAWGFRLNSSVLAFCSFSPVFIRLLWNPEFASVCFGFFFRGILLSRRSICVAPVRGGSHFLCCCKESNQRNSLSHPKSFTPAPAQANCRWHALASAPNGAPGLARAGSDKPGVSRHWFSTKKLRHSAARCRWVCKGNQRRAGAVRWPREQGSTCGPD